ncbi:MAG: M48 family metallopeptidase [Bacteroidales bacterium]|jgi:heat shock protein HtpX|nr:M48 family metallopeptidase [Bacteroidales bacterium]
MSYVGLQSQIWKNNIRSAVLLILFPLVIMALVFVFWLIYSMYQPEAGIDPVNGFLRTIPWVAAGVLLWFFIAWSSHTSMINKATGSRPLERKENKRVYNLVENLAIAAGMKRMPKVNVIEDDSLNAFASGINEKTYTISLSRGIIDRLDDDELEAVIAHELTHIRNKDVRLLIISVIFVGIFAFATQALLRGTLYGGVGRRRDSKNGLAIVLIIVLAAIGWLLTTLFRFALSRKREYLADAGSAELTRKPYALASALRKVSGDPRIEAVTRKDVAQMFIENPGVKKKGASFSTLFATHPPIQERIRVLEGMM